ncbi:glycoside hydrolase family 2 protein [Sphingobacterium thalpophilum]|uniref:Exo-beta-D-glucosaminidase n=1 Tax=Sphingobacterium thalpophilum TaxID=259 RepID=A0A4U9VKH9_9SPHI|nr:glycoside hydrolase family 2 TIM barrel-domain containing protein [Sphingobacterium thalpophilum]VTR43851.1 Exo-beta-D-glucosaminidase precursor [Sphingobacterium thalpophilum]
MTRLIYILLLLLLAAPNRAQVPELSLNSSNTAVRWEIKPKDEVPQSGLEISQPGFVLKDPVRGIVPGVVFTAYVSQGLVPDPNYADNIYRVDEKLFNRPFWYRGTFRLPAGYSKGQRIWLQFDNTNRYADFFFNGVKLSGTATSTRDVSGHMLRSKFDVTALLREGADNTVAVLISDADQKKTRSDKEAFGVTASPTYLAAAGWDWMPYVPGRLAGITGNVSLRSAGAVTLEDPWMRSDLESNEFAYLEFSTDINNASDSTQQVELTGLIQPGGIPFSKKLSIAAHSRQKVYITRNEVKEFVIHQPRLWWPNGYGEPHLYSCELTLKTGGQLSDQKRIQFGIRKYEYQYVRNRAGWPVLNFFINGKKVYLKGGNWGMSEYLLRCRGEEYGLKVKLHKDMNYNMIRLWTGSITDDAFYDYCDRYGIMVWDDFWLYVAYNDVASDADFKANALDKIKRLRNHPSIAIWCGANETRPKPELDSYLRSIVALEDHNDRLYKSSSNQDGLSGSGWWGNQPPRHHFETSGSNLAWNQPPYPYSGSYGYGLRTEIGTATFPNYESIVKFIPQDQLWPLPSDEQLKSEDDNVWNRHFFGKEASNASPIQYKAAVDTQFGPSDGLPAFAEKAQYLNLEVMKGMYEAWNDKLWDDAAGLLIWMSQSAYPSFVWQTYDYYYDATGAYWGARQACEPLHVQWNVANNSVKVINTSLLDLDSASVTARVFNLSGQEVPGYSRRATASVASNEAREVFRLGPLSGGSDRALSDLHFIRLQLRSSTGELLSENFYWHNGQRELDYTALNSLPPAKLHFSWGVDSSDSSSSGRVLTVRNAGSTVAFGNRLRMLDGHTGERILPLMISDNYFTLMPGEEKIIRISDLDPAHNDLRLLWKQYGQAEKQVLKWKGRNPDKK